MCLGIPGKVISVGETLYHPACVDVCGVRRAVNITLVCEGDPAKMIGQWVLVHVGFAMSMLNEDEARRSLAALRLMGLVAVDLDDVPHAGDTP
ncbi:hydrogenase maturation factor HybG [Martelella alba]|uniref:Hydrogenase maturation factor HybG n=2 Tax=Martelella alba TaxID=2590451 RepID=A0ABY2SMN4_9HYPH|nr:hydrogenase maturation factor HybG [Martelella alba]TKI06611.1 hydrogenase maturation factor HybG [Martelella alba]